MWWKLAPLVAAASVLAACDGIQTYPMKTPAVVRYDVDDDGWSPPVAPLPLPKPPAPTVRLPQPEPSLDRWSSADHAILEAQAARGLVAVEKKDGATTLLPACVLGGSYAYTPVTPKEERLTLKDESQLKIVIPLDALSLRDEIARFGSVDVTTTTVGYYRASKVRLARKELPVGCERATHLVVAMTVGAYSVLAKSSGSWSILRSDGEPASCAIGEASETKPPRDCGAPLRLELASIDDPSRDDD